MTRFIPLVFSFFLVVHLSFGQDGPCLHILQNDTEAALTDSQCPATKHLSASSRQPLVQFRHPDKMASVDDPRGWLKAFWIFGDGNFAAFPDSNRETEMTTLDQDYIYNLPGTYEVDPLMIEKKTNQEPPGSDYRSIKIDGPSSSEENRIKKGEPAFKAQATSFVGSKFRKEITSPDKADIFSSSLVRLGGYPTAFAVSTPLPSDGTQNIVLFYYNSVQVSDVQTYNALNLFRKDNVVNKHANYSLAPGKYIIPSGGLPASLIPGRTSATFGNVLIQSVALNTSIKPDSFTEFRFFPVMSTPTPVNNSYNTGNIQLDTSGRGMTQFVALVLQNAVIVTQSDSTKLELTPGQGQRDSLSPVEKARIIQLVNQYLPWLAIDQNTLKINNTDFYIRGIYREALEIRTVIDPTELVVKSICPDEGNKGKYKVEMNLTVCNEGNSTEPLITVNLIKDPLIEISNFSCDQTQFTQKLDTNIADIILKFTYADGLLGAYENPQKKYVSSCFDVGFSLTTDWAGAQMLQQGKALKADVTFSLAIVNRTQSFPNLPFMDSPMTPGDGYNCGSKDCTWLIIVLLALGIVFWWLWRNKKEEEGLS